MCQALSTPLPWPVYRQDCKEVHLDDNLRRANMSAPMFVEPASLREMELALWADTTFLASLDIMDYSLLVRIVLLDPGHVHWGLQSVLGAPCVAWHRSSCCCRWCPSCMHDAPSTQCDKPYDFIWRAVDCVACCMTTALIQSAVSGWRPLVGTHRTK